MPEPNTLEYDGYVARIEYDAQLHEYHGRVINIPDVVNFKSCSRAALPAEFAQSIAVYRESLRDEGEEPPPA